MSGYLGFRKVPTLENGGGIWRVSEQAKFIKEMIWPKNERDDYFQNVILLLHGEGNNNSTSFVDSSINNLTVVANGNAKISTNKSKFGSSSIYFDGNNDYLTVSSQNQVSPGNFGSGNFTVECFVNLISRVSSFPCIFSNYSSFGGGSLALFAGHVSADTTKYQIAINGTFPGIQSSASISYDAWVHIAVVRSSGVVSLYINGVSNGTINTSVSLGGTSGSLWIGSAGDAPSAGSINGYINEFRITYGVARYTGNFTPPTFQFPNI